MFDEIAISADRGGFVVELLCAKGARNFGLKLEPTDRLEVKGQPVIVVPSVMQALNRGGNWANTAAGQYNISDSGWLAHVPGGITPDPQNSLVRVDLNGNVRSVVDFKAGKHR